MKLLFFCNLFIICINAFTIQPSIPFLSKSYKNIQSHSSIFINNNNFHIIMMKNKKNNDDDNYLNEEETKNLYNIIIKNIIKNIIFCIYVQILIYKLQDLY
jgi:hypothetical protein